MKRQTKLFKNSRAYFDYEILSNYEAGIVLVGSEVKSIREGQLHIQDAYGIVRNNEIYVINLKIPKYKNTTGFIHEEDRTRKLLLKKKEIRELKNQCEKKGLSLIVLKLYFNSRNKVKIVLGLGKGRKKADKRDVEKAKEHRKEITQIKSTLDHLHRKKA